MGAARAPSYSESAAGAIYEEVLLGMTPEHQAKMRRNLKIYIVRRNETIVEAASRALREELPPQEAAAEIESLKASYAKRTSNIDPNVVRRTPVEPRGMTQRIGYTGFCFVGEENLLASTWDESGTRAGRVLFHELGHATYNIVLDDAAREALEEYDAAVHPKETDGSEAFAEATEIWFRVHQIALHQSVDDQAEIDSLPPVLRRILTSAYGPAR